MQIEKGKTYEIVDTGRVIRVKVLSVSETEVLFRTEYGATGAYAPYEFIEKLAER